MGKNKPVLHINIQQARKFLLNYHFLQYSEPLKGKSEILDYIRKVGCIQFDPVDVVGRNPDLVLNARARNYQTGLMDRMLYKDRSLLDGWDKVQSIYPVEDFPIFSRRKGHYVEEFKDANPRIVNIIPEIIEFIRENGPTSSLDLPHQEKVDWWWGRQKASRAALEVLYHTYRIQIHHRVRSRRYFDLTENLVPPEIISQPDPFKTIEEYHDAHFLRRISGLGLVRAKASDLWGGILNAKTPERRASFKRLLDAKKILKVQIAGIDNISFYINAELANELSSDISGTPRAVFVPPLDNFMWDRDLLKILFNFDYIWEIYKPAAKRKYGYYVLPVIYGQRIIARLDAKAERKQGILMMNNWWFEEDVRPSKAMVQSIRISIRRLARLLELNEIQYSSSFKEKFSDSFSSLLS